LGEEFPKLETRDVRSALRGLDEEVDRLIDVGASDGSDPVNVAGTGVDTGEPDASIHGNADAGTSAGRETRRGAARSREDDP
ncbi:MAG: hypothetical protein ABEL76_12065, partial [Bradymonadaceae bacterium]